MCKIVLIPICFPVSSQQSKHLNMCVCRCHLKCFFAFVCFRIVHLDNRGFLLEPVQTTYFTQVKSSPLLGPLVFTGVNVSLYTHQDHTIHYIRETEWHRQVRQKHRDLTHIAKKLAAKEPPPSPTKVIQFNCYLVILAVLSRHFCCQS